LEVPCTHYAFEAISGHKDEWGNQLGECFVFGDCTNQKEATSTVYALEDWCQKSNADGGCPEIWCDDEGGHPGWTVCDFPKRPDCSLEECIQHCADSTGLKTPCTHYVFQIRQVGRSGLDGIQLGGCFVHTGCDHRKEEEYDYHPTYTVYRLTEAQSRMAKAERPPMATTTATTTGAVATPSEIELQMNSVAGSIVTLLGIAAIC
jgi:hypothetical protein